MNAIIEFFIRLKVRLMMLFARIETKHSWATVAQLMYEYENLLDDKQRESMLTWAKDPECPNPNAIYFYNNVMRFKK